MRRSMPETTGSAMPNLPLRWSLALSPGLLVLEHPGMIPFLRKSSPFALSALLFCGCAAPVAESGGPNQVPVVETGRYNTVWQRGAFQVSFSAGENVFMGRRAPSSFTIAHTGSDGKRGEVTTTSYISRGVIDNMDEPRPENKIRILSDTAQQQLIIEEDIPNQTGPWVNTTLVTLRKDGELTVRYLDLPLRKSGKEDKGITEEYPLITGFDSGSVTLKYPSSRQTEQRELSSFRSLPAPRSGP